MTMDKLDEVKHSLTRMEWLDRLAEPLQSAIRALFQRTGSVGQWAANALHGVWLGHPLHPVLTDIPIGAWTVGLALDAIETSSGSESFGKAADTAIQIGVAGAGAAAVAGYTDWQHLNGKPRRAGLLHALLNTVALGLFIASLTSRKKGDRSTGKALALAGFTIAGTSAYIGGELVFAQKIGVNHAPLDISLKKFTPVIALDDLPENRPTRAMAGETALVLVRQGRQVFALAERCSHLGGPLADGKLELDEDGSPSVICPWHGSRFRMADGAVQDGPATYAQPCFETRIQRGQVEVRHRPTE